MEYIEYSFIQNSKFLESYNIKWMFSILYTSLFRFPSNSTSKTLGPFYLAKRMCITL